MWHVIADGKQFTQRSVIRFVAIYYVELLRASEGTLSTAAFAVVITHFIPKG
jgi:hypothetical protein